jgi:dolichol-phosphate mannosyltransferase
MSDVAAVAKYLFESDDEPIFTENLRSWDLEQWYANPVKARDVLRWSTVTSFSEGLAGTAQWYLNGREALLKLPRSSTPAEPQRAQHKLSAIIACYKDAEAIPVMYNRLVETFASIGCDYEIIFVNDCSPDESQAVIQRISAMDPHVIGVLHTRNFGSQSAFISGLRIASGDACVLLDGDLQDPPELIKDFHEKFREGFDVVYGVRVSREATPLLRVFYKAFYRVLARLSSFPVPRDAGDFSLMSRAVVDDLLGFSERELFLRTKRAYIGRRQTGVPYHRPERMFGSSTNSSMRNLQWAIRGIISSSRKPLSVLGIVGASLSALSLLAVLVQVTIRLLRPDLSPPGIVSVVTVTGLFGSLNLLGISIIGEYVGRILEESRGRPRFIQHSVTRGGIERAPEARDGSKST